MKLSTVICVILILSGPFFLFTIFGQSGGLMRQRSICIYSADSVAQYVEIESSLIKFGNLEDLRSTNRSEIVGRIERRNELIEVEYWSRKYFPTFQLLVKINPKQGGSSVHLYGRQELSQKSKEKYDSLLSMLELEYGFSSSEPGDFNQCS